MSTRAAAEIALDPDVFGEPVDRAALSPEEKTFIQEGSDELDRGEFITHEAMKLQFKRMREKYAQK